MVLSDTSVIRPKSIGFTRSQNSSNNTRSLETSVTGQITSMNLLPKDDPRASEDCLLLDVVVPHEIFDGRNGRDFDPGEP